MVLDTNHLSELGYGTSGIQLFTIALCWTNLWSVSRHYARMANHNLCEVVQDIPPGAARRRWTLRADNHGHYHGIVRRSECPLYLELDWRPTAVDSVRGVGVFRLNLTGLLRDRYIRPEPADSHGPNVRLRIIRADDGSFYVQTNEHGPRLLLASRAA